MRAVLIVFLLLLAGCASPIVQEPTVEPAPQNDPVESSYKPNLWLLDGPRPAVTTQVSDGAEPSILTDQDGEFIWVGDTSGGHYSEDNGTSWHPLPDYVLPGAFNDGWALAQDDAGNLYAMALTGPELEIARSSDGKTWDYTSPFVQVSGVTDRPWMSARGDGEVAVIYYDAPVAIGLYEACARSTDGGETWLDVSRVLTAGTPQAGNFVHDSDGDLVYINSRGTIYEYPDGICFPGPDSHELGSNLGANNMIQLDATPDGSLFVASAVDGNRAVELYGEKGTQKQRLIVSDPLLLSNTFVSVSTFEDYIAVGWYGSETSGDPSAVGFNGAFNVYLTIVKDFWGKSTMEHWRITDEPNHVGDICMGGVGCTDGDRDLLDYWMLDFDIWGGVHLAYGHDGTSSNAVVRYAQVSADQIQQRFEPTPPSSSSSASSSTQPLPVAAFSAETTDLTVSVDASASTGTGLDYKWGFGDEATKTGKTTSHTFSEAGTYTIRLAVKDISGKIDQTSRTISVQEGKTNLAPTASFSYSHKGAGSPVQFLDASTDDGTIMRWSWDFGDGTTGNIQSPVHTYPGAGTYTVTLVVEDDAGATSTAQGQIELAATVAEETTSTPAAPLLLLGVMILALAWIARRRD